MASEHAVHKHDSIFVRLSKGEEVGGKELSVISES